MKFIQITLWWTALLAVVSADSSLRGGSSSISARELFDWNNGDHIKSFLSVFSERWEAKRAALCNFRGKDCNEQTPKIESPPKSEKKTDTKENPVDPHVEQAKQQEKKTNEVVESRIVERKQETPSQPCNELGNCNVKTSSTNLEKDTKVETPSPDTKPKKNKPKKVETPSPDTKSKKNKSKKNKSKKNKPKRDSPCDDKEGDCDKNTTILINDSKGETPSDPKPNKNKLDDPCDDKKANCNDDDERPTESDEQIKPGSPMDSDMVPISLETGLPCCCTCTKLPCDCKCGSFQDSLLYSAFIEMKERFIAATTTSQETDANPCKGGNCRQGGAVQGAPETDEDVKNVSIPPCVGNNCSVVDKDAPCKGDNCTTASVKDLAALMCCCPVCTSFPCECSCDYFTLSQAPPWGKHEAEVNITSVYD